MLRHSARDKAFSRSLVFQTCMALLVSLYAASFSFSSESFSGSTFDQLTKILRARSEETGERFLLTRKASARGPGTKTHNKLDSQLESSVINGWTVLHLSGEDIPALQERERKNRGVWESTLPDRASDRKPMTVAFSRADIAYVNVVVRRACGVTLEFASSQRVFLSFVVAKGMPTRDFCRDYMTVLAANDIVVRQKDGRLVAEFDDTGNDERKTGR